MPSAVRPTKKQQELLVFVRDFIAEHGYSPSYREIMNGCHYTSVATVALHINSLIARGHIVKRGRSARSLEVVSTAIDPIETDFNSEISATQEKWLVDFITGRFLQAESKSIIEQSEIDELYVLVGALKVMGLEGAAMSFIPRLTAIKNK
jgi:SOS-response transcriptional repressor LexA